MQVVSLLKENFLLCKFNIIERSTSLLIRNHALLWDAVETNDAKSVEDILEKISGE